jgi:hypothetical protein
MFNRFNEFNGVKEFRVSISSKGLIGSTCSMSSICLMSLISSKSSKGLLGLGVRQVQSV